MAKENSIDQHKKDKIPTLEDIGYTKEHMEALIKRTNENNEPKYTTGGAYSVKMSQFDNPLDILKELLS